MRKSDLGEFEEIVLLAVGALEPNAYSVVVAEELEKLTRKIITTGAVHASLQRLESKGLVTSKMSEATQVRGGRRKRIFRVTASGKKVLQQVRGVREELWGRININAWLKPAS